MNLKFPITFNGPILIFTAYDFLFQNPTAASSKTLVQKNKNKGSVTLYAPKDLSFQFSNTWQEALIPSLSHVGSSALKNILENKLTGEVGNSIFGAVGKQFAPNDMLIYAKTSNIKMDLEFEMIPDNKNEAVAINSIVDWFKINALPQIPSLKTASLGNANNMLIKFPQLFDITLGNTGHATTGQLISQRFMALTDFAVSYGSEDDEVYFVMSDGQPAKTTLKIGFECILPYVLEEKRNISTTASTAQNSSTQQNSTKQKYNKSLANISG